MRISAILILLALSACADDGYQNGQSFSNFMATDPQIQRGLSMMRGENPYAPPRNATQDQLDSIDMKLRQIQVCQQTPQFCY